MANAAQILRFEDRNTPQSIDIPSEQDITYLRRGLNQAGGKLPLFDLDGQAFDADMIRRCIAMGWAEPWFRNPTKPDWLVCKLTSEGRLIAEKG
jgi:hypothetical protein